MFNNNNNNRLQRWAEIAWVSDRRRRPLAAAVAAWLVIHGAAAGIRRNPRRMSSAWRRQLEHDPLVGLMLAGQQSRPRPGVTSGGGATDFNG